MERRDSNSEIGSNVIHLSEVLMEKVFMASIVVKIRQPP